MAIHDWTRVPAGIFHHFHFEWIAALSRVLNSGRLPAGYYALAEQIAGGREPDVLALQEARADRPEAPEGSGGLALATAPPRVRFQAEAEADRYAAKRRRISIRHSSNDRVVALVEIVSPGNKDRASAVRDFVDKAVQFLDHGIHLLIVDLFPPSPHDPEGIHGAIWPHFSRDEFKLPTDEPLTLVSYSAGPVKRAFIEPVAIGNSLPEMPLFLEPETYVQVPLDTTYAAAFADVPQRWRAELAPAG
jgi:hypothetical protein